VLGWHLLTRHNIGFYQRLMRKIREHIVAGTFAEFYRTERIKLAMTDGTEENGGRTTVLRSPDAEELGDYEVHRHPKGFASIRQRSSGEIMHSVSEPTEEAERLYIQQSGLAARLSSPQPLTIWDVGLGAATNAMAAIRCWESVPDAAPLRIISFERDLDPLRLALKNPERFRYLDHPAPQLLLEQGRWESERARLRWELLEGDFQLLLETAPPPDLIFYDPFSSKTDGALWTPAIFSRLYRHSAERAAELYTYSASTAVRASLLAAGFHVAKGFPTGPKLETTVAFIPHKQDRKRDGLLGEEWLQRWGRSGAKFPGGLNEESREAFAARIQSHPQFVV
jgi:queuine tRNA-ribosyltransferase